MHNSLSFSHAAPAMHTSLSCCQSLHTFIHALTGSAEPTAAHSRSHSALHSARWQSIIQRLHRLPEQSLHPRQCREESRLPTIAHAPLLELSSRHHFLTASGSFCPLWGLCPQVRAAPLASHSHPTSSLLLMCSVVIIGFLVRIFPQFFCCLGDCDSLLPTCIVPLPFCLGQSEAEGSFYGISHHKASSMKPHNTHLIQCLKVKVV